MRFVSTYCLFERAGARSRSVALLLILFTGGLIAPPDSTAQSSAEYASGIPVWELFVDGEVYDDSLLTGQPFLDANDVPANLLEELRESGHYFARIDSIKVDTSNVPVVFRLYARRGPLVRVGEITITGIAVFSEEEILREMETRRGEVLNTRKLESDLESIARRYERAGYPLAEVSVDRIDANASDPYTLDLDFSVREGVRPKLSRIDLKGAKRTRSDFALRLANLQKNLPLTLFDPEAIRDRLLESGLFTQVGFPELVVESDSGVVVSVEVIEAPPGSFDLVLGYQPPRSAGAASGIVGNGHLLMQNVFGGGRQISIRLNRLPGQVSSLDLHVSDPFVFKTPIRLDGSFNGYQQDSLYAKQAFSGEAGYKFRSGMEVFVTLTSETTRPGGAGVDLRNGRQVIPRSQATFAGLGLRYQRIDDRVNPRKGLAARIDFEQGRKNRSERSVTADSDTAMTYSRLRQSRVKTDVMVFFPTFSRQVLVLGGQLSLLVSDSYDRADLFRFGGALSLRGYDEDQFVGRVTARSLVEYRYQMDRSSYGYLFTDLGYYNTPTLPGVESAEDWLSGFGLGIQFSTGVGLINASYAMSPQDGPTNGRVHVGLSFGL